MSTLEIVSDNENKLLSRREVAVIFVGGSGLITRQSAAEAISARLGVKKESVQVISLFGKFGNRDLDGKAYIFTDNSAVKRQLRPYIMMRQLPKDQRKQAREEAKKAKTPSAGASEAAVAKK